MTKQQELSDRRIALAEATRRAEPSAFVVEARVIRRLIREHFTLPFVFKTIPHSQVYVASYEELLRDVHLDELGLSEKSDLPSQAVLLAEPTDRDLEQTEEAELRQKMWRSLFHGLVDRAIKESRASDTLTTAEIRRHIDELGQVTFDEIHTVLRQENRLLDEASPEEAWCEFVAVYLEFLFFAPTSIEVWFPSLRDRDIRHVLPDIGAERFVVECRINGSSDAAGLIEAPETEPSPETELELARTGVQNTNRFRRLTRSAQKAAIRNNNVRAAIRFSRALDVAPDGDVQTTIDSAVTAIDKLVARLREALNFDDGDAQKWHDALVRLLPHATSGFWNSDRKLLYDLQKVCSDHEQLTYKVDLVKWIVSRGKRQIKRPLPNQREVMMSKHLRSAASRLPYIHLSGVHREQLSELIRDAATSADLQMRQRLRGIVGSTLTEVGFEPNNIPERVAFGKVTEECLDCIADRGYLTMGYLRDALSRNNLKLPDVTSPRQVITGDRLLRADDRFDETLDGVYHRGEFYLRWLQVVSSLAFGTDPGRFVTRFIAIPFGGAFLVVEGVKYITSHLMRATVALPPSGAADAKPTMAAIGQHGLPATFGEWLTFLWPVLVWGVFLMALIHNQRYRESTIAFLKTVGRALKTVLFDWPMKMLQWKVLKQLLRTRFVRLANRWVLTPALFAGVVCVIAPWVFGFPPPPWKYIAATFALLSIFVNSRLGRDLEELTIEWISLRWYQLRAAVFVALFEWVWETFDKMLEFLERFLYAIDEWLRFRSGETVVTLAMKAVLGVVWSLVDFVIRFCVNLLIEPQVNPIKHFPVVTVSHKLLLPTLPVVLGPILAPVVGGEEAAQALAITIATVIPGVFGFLVWELKENWRLYAANQSARVRPVAVGSHGETMLRLLKPGFHSGTLPKLYHKLRKLDRKSASFRRLVQQQAVYEKLHHVEEDIRHHVQRELFAYLGQTDEWRDEIFLVEQLEATSNSICVSLGWERDPEAPLILIFQEQSGWLVAGILQPGWAAKLDGSKRDSFLAALLGFYKVGAVDMVREQIRHSLADPDLAYDITDKGLKVWPGDSFRMEFTYNLENRPVLTPKPASAGRRAGLPDIRPDELILSEAPLVWHHWVGFWDSENQRDSARLLAGRVLVGSENGQATNGEVVES